MHLAVLLPLVVLPFSLAKNIPVKVGSGGLVFSPDHVTAAKGDTVEFTFYPQNHSVAQSTFDKPCEAMDKGIFSGFFPTTSTASKVFTVTVDNTDPIWLYCSTPGHCQSGMAMVINEPSDNKLSTYKTNSLETSSSSQSEVGGGVVSDQNSGSSSSAVSSASSASTAASKTSASGTAASGTTATGTTATGTAASGTAATTGTASGTTATPTGAAGKLNAGAGLGALGLLGLLVGGMV